jgi:hypothetical protein
MGSTIIAITCHPSVCLQLRSLRSSSQLLGSARLVRPHLLAPLLRPSHLSPAAVVAVILLAPGQPRLVRPHLLAPLLRPSHLSPAMVIAVVLSAPGQHTPCSSAPAHTTPSALPSVSSCSHCGRLVGSWAVRALFACTWPPRSFYPWHLLSTYSHSCGVWQYIVQNSAMDFC